MLLYDHLLWIPRLLLSGAAVVLLVCLAIVGRARGDELAEARRLAPKYQAVTEYRLDDGTRVDLLSDRYAIEVDWAKSGKCYEAIGQALYYGLKTQRLPAVILLVKNSQRDARYVERTRLVCEHYGIALFVEPAGAPHQVAPPPRPSPRRTLRSILR